ncbi:DUF4439 domain-containing protein [Arthrobacter alpinus]|uniref:DUF4439 domain-containing protein n=1 Tax=Arthrobacter alpinus TaxID=656366 RepID=UPI000A560FDB|nr:DUF4439 domain-containing protein [Arthrobacter alpinus]
MTNSRSSVEPPVDTPGHGTAMPPTASVKPRRTGSRRVSSPAGAPATATAGSALLILGANGLLLTPASPTRPDDGGTPAVAVSVAQPDATSQATEEPETVSAVATEEPETVSAVATEEPEPVNAVATEEPEPVNAVAEPALDATVAAEPLAPEPALDTAPTSRRERRLAEQKVLDGVVPVPVPDPVSPAAAAGVEDPESRPAARAGKPPRMRNKFWSYLRGFLFFTAIAAVVIGMGTVVTGQGAPTDGPNATEITRQHAWIESKALLETAQELGRTAASETNINLLASTAAALEIQIAALADGLPTPSVAPTPTTSAVAATIPGFVTALTANANILLSAAVSAEGSMGRAFAATGTSQLLAATAISQANGVPVPTSTFLLTAAAGHEAPAAQVCNTMLTPQPGVSSDAALIAAAQGEQKAVFAYQVAATRLHQPDFSKSVELLAEHQQRLVLLNRELVLRCLPQTVPVPGYVLDGAFTAAPKLALAELEGQLTLVYGDAAALSKPLRDGSPETAGAAPQESPATVSQLRELSVSWLLGSALNQQSWGGTVGALPGIAEPVPAAPTAAAVSTP